MTFFRILWGIDVVVAAIAVVFFFIGIADGSVSSFNIVQWALLLAALAVVLVGSGKLSQRGMKWPAIALAGVLAVPALLFGLMIVLFAVSGARWN